MTHAIEHDLGHGALVGRLGACFIVTGGSKTVACAGAIVGARNEAKGLGRNDESLGVSANFRKVRMTARPGASGRWGSEPAQVKSHWEKSQCRAVPLAFIVGSMTEIAQQDGPAPLALRAWGASVLESGSGSASTSAAHEDRHPECRVSGGIAYFTNVYPKISHSLIRTEIEALERRGLKIHRYTIRRSGEHFEDPEDRDAAERTDV